MMNALCASVNLLAFMRFHSLSSQENVAENSSFKRSSLQGADQLNWSKVAVRASPQRAPVSIQRRMIPAAR